ncbi:hypothetical protein K378_01448 [Streptomyces sp. Amel2xB2]|uniref:hypothetical protein n=1 Tax=Streptomyces sp. Amel2xB2 TaxID=1305829 RepID=UPI000DB94BF3|nr:hypothetical protein [Streptomyces sp. Amel2xB2]RAJ70283.1 hypothetical protein K378_01448 [Streptomyces sp. Amel2xB2]
MATSTRTRKPATKPAEDAGTEQAPAVPDFTTSTPKPKKDERKPLFSIDGETFTVPKVIGQRITYLGLERMRKDGALLSSMYLMELLLGPEQHAKLMSLYEAERITEEQFDQIAGLISDIFFKRANAVENPEEGKGEGSASTSTTS